MSAKTQPQIDIEIKEQIRDFLYEEVFLLDNRKYIEWLDLLAEDLVYKMPLRETIDRFEGKDVSDEISYFDETKVALTTRVKRLYTKSAWVEKVPPRQRHFISNIVITRTENDDEYNVRSYFLFKRSRGSNTDIEEMFGERHDIIRKETDGWKIARRIIIPDQAVITTINMAMFL